jgi:endonuclease YncB( thermonuclease family)
MITAPILCAFMTVHDGDGPVRCDGRNPPLRIAGIQAPDFENAQPCRERPIRKGFVCDNRKAAASRDALIRMLRRGQIAYVRVGTDYYRRGLIKVYVGERNVACDMIADGWAAAAYEARWTRECR